MYTTLREVTKKAEELNITVGAFNMHNLEMLPAMIRAAKELDSPIIIQTSAGTAKYIGMSLVANVCKFLAEKEDVDVVLHLDHASNFSDIKEAIESGFSSVMFDGSSLPLEENIMKTREVVEYAHARGISVEGELGIIGGTEDGHTVSEEDKVYTNPEDAKRFVEQTGVDALAVAIGTSHGQYKSKTKINVNLLKQINERVDIPLVVHGGTGVKEEEIHQCIDNGIRKFNVGTELLVGWTKKAKETFGQTKENASLRNNIVPCNDVVKEIVKRKISVFLNS